MNIRKKADYSAMYFALDTAMVIMQRRYLFRKRRMNLAIMQSAINMY
jgi:hypothetical protein